MIRRSFRIGLTLGLLAGAALALVKALQGRRPADSPGTPDWPRIAEPSPPPASTPVTTDPVVPPAEADVTAAPGPDPQPARAAGQSGRGLPGAEVETHQGAAADAHAADDDRQPDTATPDWAPPGTEAPPTTADTGSAEQARAAGPGPIPSTEATRPPRVAKAAKQAAKAAKAAKKAAKKVAPASTAAAPWVGPEGRSCPSSHPVKAKLTSRIFHLPGMLNYERTTPDRCYVDAAAAEADGLRAAKR